MRRPCILIIAGTVTITGAVAADAAMAPRVTVENEGRKNHVLTTVGANLAWLSASTAPS